MELLGIYIHTVRCVCHQKYYDCIVSLPLANGKGVAWDEIVIYSEWFVPIVKLCSSSQIVGFCSHDKSSRQTLFSGQL